MNDRIDSIIALLERHRVVRLSVVALFGVVALFALWLVAARAFQSVSAENDRVLSLALIAQREAEQENASRPGVSADGLEHQPADAPAVVPNDVRSDMPRIDMIGEPAVEVLVGESYTDDGARAFDAEGDALPLRTYVDGALVEMVVIDTSAPDTREIEYRASTGGGVRASAMRTVIVH